MKCIKKALWGNSIALPIPLWCPCGAPKCFRPGTTRIGPNSASDMACTVKLTASFGGGHDTSAITTALQSGTYLSLYMYIYIL